MNRVYDIVVVGAGPAGLAAATAAAAAGRKVAVLDDCPVCHLTSYFPDYSHVENVNLLAHFPGTPGLRHTSR